MGTTAFDKQRPDLSTPCICPCERPSDPSEVLLSLSRLFSFFTRSRSPTATRPPHPATVDVSTQARRGQEQRSFGLVDHVTTLSRAVARSSCRRQKFSARPGSSRVSYCGHVERDAARTVPLPNPNAALFVLAYHAKSSRRLSRTSLP